MGASQSRKSVLPAGKRARHRLATMHEFAEAARFDM